MKQILKIIKIFKETISDGPGFRYSIYFSGCIHGCKGCHNPETWKGDIGKELDSRYLEEIISQINSNPILDGVTLSGGDPFFKPLKLLEFLKELKDKTEINIWAYTGYTYEQLMSDPVMRMCLDYIDVLVDGRFVEDLRNPTLYFRGSSNQRVIDVKESLINKEVVQLNYR